MSYVQDNEMSELTIESIETIYLKIWNDLTEKQIYSPTPDDKNNIEVLINKKGIMYSHIKDIFSIMTDVQLPEKGKISEFCRSNKMFYDTTSYSDFIKLFKEFRIESAKRGFDVIHESIECLKENNDTLSILMDDTYIFSKKVLEILDNDKTICSSEFYKKFRVCLAIYNTYRAFNF